MDFFRSRRRTRNQSKRFPTRELSEDSGPIQTRVSSKEELDTSQISKKTTRAEKDLKIKIDKSHSTNIVVPSSNNSTQDLETIVPTPAENTKRYLESASSPEIPETQTPTVCPPAKAMSSSDSMGDFDLKPPPTQKTRNDNVENLSDLLYSEGYLRTLTSDAKLLSRFTGFLSRHKPEIAHLVAQYLETQKIIKAVDYANAVAASFLHHSSPKVESNSPPVEISSSFKEASQHAFNTLLDTALPAWVTYSLVKTATSCLTAEISNQTTALTHDLVGGLSEVFTISDPKLPDNPLVYASEEFYRLTGYNKSNVLSHNCRFLQGSKTKVESVQRLSKAIAAGEEICETLLNYRRDGTPFVNILLLAPLHDNKGHVKYYLGAQVDASRLVEGGRGVDGFERFLTKRKLESDGPHLDSDSDPKHVVFARLRELGKTFDLEENAAVQSPGRNDSMASGAEKFSKERLNLVEEDEADSDSDNDSEKNEKEEDKQAWTLSDEVGSGKLPGIYNKYVLIRAYPSLRMIFVSQGARKLGRLQQHPLFSHIAAPHTTLTGLKDAFKSGTPVTAKVAIMRKAGEDRDGVKSGRWGRKNGRSDEEEDPAKLGRTCWISATPLKDSNDRIGVWMVVIVDQGSVAANVDRSSSLTSRIHAESKQDFETRQAEENSRSSSKPTHIDMPIKPKKIGSLENGAGKTTNGTTKHEGPEKAPEEASGNASPKSAKISQNGIDEKDDNNSTLDELLRPLDVDEAISLQHDDSPETEEPSTSAQSSIDAFVETTSQSSVSRGGRGIGLRAMDAKISHKTDYMNSRSLGQQVRSNDDVHGFDDKRDINSTPYSVD